MAGGIDPRLLQAQGLVAVPSREIVEQQQLFTAIQVACTMVNSEPLRQHAMENPKAKELVKKSIDLVNSWLKGFDIQVVEK